MGKNIVSTVATATVCIGSHCRSMYRILGTGPYARKDTRQINLTVVVLEYSTKYVYTVRTQGNGRPNDCQSRVDSNLQHTLYVLDYSKNSAVALLQYVVVREYVL